MKNFVTEIIDADLASNKHDGRVHTRFPPEPNGYLHIGHAKSICLNFGLAAQYGGKCNLRFDDTNPTTEDAEYVESIQADIQWLGFQWDGDVCFASNYFEQFYAWALYLIDAGKAYVDEQSVEEIRLHRGSAQEPGRPSPYRDRPATESRKLLEAMRAGSFEDGAMVLRAKIDMSHPNILMRDPLIYRIRRAPHHRTGDAWCIYPMYDYAHCLEDAIEGITHSVCTLEFDNNRALYDWFLDNLPVPFRPHQYEMSRLDLSHTVMSKRWLLQLVEQGVVRGWDDPRMPTLAGLRRRGVPPEAVQRFCRDVGVTKSNALTSPALLDFHIRETLNHEAPRVLVVQDPLPITLTNVPIDEVRWIDADLWPHDVPKEGTRPVALSRDLLIERSDYADAPPKGFKRLTEGGVVRLRHGGVIRCDHVKRSKTGTVTHLECTLLDDGEGPKPKGTIQWLSAEHSLPTELHLVDRLFLSSQPGSTDGVDWLEEINPESLKVIEGARMEPWLDQADPGDRFQFERQGYFMKDGENSPSGHSIFVRIVELRDGWAKKQNAPAPSKPEPKPIAKVNVPVQIAPRSDALQKRMQRLQTHDDLSEQDAERLTRDEATDNYFQRGLDAGASPRALASLILNDIPTDGRPPVEHLVELLALEANGTVRRNQRSTVLNTMFSSQISATEAVTSLGLSQQRSLDLTKVIAQVVDQHPTERDRYRSGEKQLFGFFMGACMRATKGSADPKALQKALRSLLEDR